MLTLLSGLWNRTAAIIVGVVGLIAALIGIRARIRSGAQLEMAERIQARTLENIRIAQEIENEVDQSDGDAIRDRLRREGWLRE